MEKNKLHVEEDAFLKKYLQEIKLDSPRSSFTENILDLILKEEKSIVKNTPLISKKMWFIAAGFLATCVFFLFKEKNTTSLRFPEIDFSFIPSLQMPTIFGSFTISSTIMYAVVGFSLMFFIQIAFLKNHFNKRFD